MASREQSSITCKATSPTSLSVDSVTFYTVYMYCYVHSAACFLLSSVKVSGAISLITLETLEPHRANAPMEVGILSLSVARSHIEDSLQTAWIDSCDRQGEKGGKRWNTHILYCHHLLILHVFRRRNDIRSRLRRWMKAGLATETAGIATETVDVRPSGVVGHPACLGVERVLLIYVVILSVPEWK